MAIIASQLIGKVGLEGSEKTKADLQEIGRKTDETKEHFRGLKDALSTAAGFAISGGVSAGFGFLKDQVTDVIKLTSEFEQTQAQTAQVLKSTHDVSGMTAEALDNLAEKYGKTTMFSADTVKGGENLLLTFTNIGKKVFPDATQAILDVSQAMGQDLKESAIQVGKALGDPTTGMTALQRIGVTFSASEKEQIKTMMAHNDIIGAQKVILHELATEFGGSATAAGKTFQGQWEEIGHTLEEDKEKIGGALLPVLGDLLNKYVTPLATKFSDWMTKGGGLHDFQIWIKQVVQLFENQFLPDLKTLLNTYIIPLVTQFYNLFIQSGFVQSVWNDITGILQVLVPLLGGTLQWAAQNGVFSALGVALKSIADALGGIIHFAGDFLKWLQDSGPPADVLKYALIGIAGALGIMKTGNLIFSAADALKGLGAAMSGASLAGAGLLLLLSAEVGLIAWLITHKQEVASWGDTIREAGYNSGRAWREFWYDVGKIFQSMGQEVTIQWDTFWGKLGLSVHNFVVGIEQSISNLFSWLGTTLSNAAKNIPLFGSISVPGHASGILNNPVGHWAMVGERGPEPMYVPQGASILPSGSAIPSGGVGGSPVVVQFNINGYQFARAVMPDFVTAMRGGTGRLGI